MQFDLGARYTTGRLRLAGYFYHYRITNLVERYPTGDRTSSASAIAARADARVRGRDAGGSRARATRWKSRAQVGRGRALDDDADWTTSRRTRSRSSCARRSRPKLDGLRAASPSTPTTTGLARAKSRRRVTRTSTSARAGSRRSALEVRGVVRNLLNQEYYASPDPRFVLAPGINGSSRSPSGLTSSELRCALLTEASAERFTRVDLGDCTMPRVPRSRWSISIREYPLQQGALEIAYIEEYFNEFPERKTAAEIMQRLEGREFQILMAEAPLPDDRSTVVPVSYKVSHELREHEDDPKLVDLVDAAATTRRASAAADPLQLAGRDAARLARPGTLPRADRRAGSLGGRRRATTRSSSRRRTATTTCAGRSTACSST